MKFKDLVEGKKYTCESHEYTKIDGLLWNGTLDNWSGNDMEKVSTMDFEPCIEYCYMNEAVKWMREGNFAEFLGKSYSINSLGFLVDIDYRKCYFNTIMLTENKWIKKNSPN